MRRNQRLALIAAIMGSFVVGLDATVVNVALPAIEEDLGGGLAGQQWVSNAYLLTLGSLILVAGSLGDLYGERRVFSIGVGGFGLVSALALAGCRGQASEKPPLWIKHGMEFQPKALGVGDAPDRYQHHVGLACSCGAAIGRLDTDLMAGAVAGNARHLVRQVEGHALPGQDALCRSGDVQVHAREDAVKEFDHLHLGAETAPDGAQLQPDDASADDQHLLRHALEGQRAGR